jgi:hypothetical protein
LDVRVEATVARCSEEEPVEATVARCSEEEPVEATVVRCSEEELVEATVVRCSEEAPALVVARDLAALVAAEAVVVE